MRSGAKYRDLGLETTSALKDESFSASNLQGGIAVEMFGNLIRCGSSRYLADAVRLTGENGE